MNKPTVLLTGTYSSYNKGDAAMQISTAQAVKDLWPNAKVIISAPFPEFDTKFYKEHTVIKSSRRNLIKGTLQVVRAKLYRVFKIQALIDEPELKAFMSADIIIDLSGDTLTEDYGPHVTYSHFLPILLGLACRKPVFVCAQSIGPFKLTTWFAKHTLNRVSKITVREKITYDYLRSIGVKTSNLEQTADMAFLLKPSTKKEAEKILKKERIDVSKKPLLGVTVSNLVEKRYNKNSGHADADFIADIAAMLDEVVRTQKAHVVFIGHVTGPSLAKDDRIVAKKIQEKMQAKSNSSVLVGNYRPEELKAIISLCDVILGSRMHSNIGALSTHTPTVAIGYSHKTDGIMNSLDMKEYTFSIDDLDTKKLEATLSKAIKNRKTIHNKLAKGVPKIVSESNKNVKIIKSLVVD